LLLAYLHFRKNKGNKKNVFTDQMWLKKLLIECENSEGKQGDILFVSPAGY
jgi:hypothetical protein